MKKTIISLFFLTLSALVLGQSYDKILYTHYVNGSVNQWEKILANWETEVLSTEDTYQLALSYYGFIGYCISVEEKDLAKQSLKKAIPFADQLIAQNEADARFQALRGAYYGLMISVSPHKAPFIGMKALRRVNNAMNLDPTCPQALVESGNKNWWVPEIFGGSKTEAVKDYERAIQILSKNDVQQVPAWYQLNIRFMLADYYSQLEQPAKANYLYKELQKIEPNLDWAKLRKNSFKQLPTK